MMILQIRLRYIDLHYLRNYIHYQVLSSSFVIPTILITLFPGLFSRFEAPLVPWMIMIATSLFYFVGVSIWIRNRLTILNYLGTINTMKMFELYITAMWGLHSFGVSFFLFSMEPDFNIPALRILGWTLVVIGYFIKFYAHLCVGLDSYIWRDLITNTPNQVYYQSAFFRWFEAP